MTPDKSEGPSDDVILFTYDNSSLGGTALIQRTVELVSAHKLTISEMVEVSVDNTSMPQEREQYFRVCCSTRHRMHAGACLFICNIYWDSCVLRSVYEGRNGAGPAHGTERTPRHAPVHHPTGESPTGKERVYRCPARGVAWLPSL